MEEIKRKDGRMLLGVFFLEEKEEAQKKII